MEIAILLSESQEIQKINNVFRILIPYAEEHRGTRLHLVCEGPPGRDILKALDKYRTQVSVEVKDIKEISHREISEYVEEKNINLLVLAIGIDEKLSKWVIGSNLSRIIFHANIPVLVVREFVPPIHRILVCESGAGEESSLRRLLKEWNKWFSREYQVTVLHVMSQISAGPGVKGWQLRATAEEIIEKETPEGEVLGEDLSLLEQHDVEVKAKLRHGIVIDEIKKETEENQYDLVVIGAHSRRIWPDRFLVDLSHEIIDEVTQPVLIIPPQ